MVRCITIALVLLLPLGARAQLQGFPTEVRFPSVTVGSIPAGPEVTGWIFQLPGLGPFPAIILAHTCAGYGLHTVFHQRLGMAPGQLGLSRARTG
jgi:hypothetical protein